jgi:hypothetical protein
MQIQEKRDQNVPTVTLSVDQLKRVNENYKFLANFCLMILNVPLETMCKQDFIDFGNIAARTESIEHDFWKAAIADILQDFGLTDTTASDLKDRIEAETEKRWEKAKEMLEWWNMINHAYETEIDSGRDK